MSRKRVKLTNSTPISTLNLITEPNIIKESSIESSKKNKYDMKIIFRILSLLIIMIILFFAWFVDRKELKHYKNGGTLLCKIDKWFTDDIYRNINNSNSSYIGAGNPVRNPSPAGFEQGDLFFNIDDCAIK